MSQAGAKLNLLADRRFWVAAAERSIFTGAQVILAQLVVFSSDDIATSGLGVVPWEAMGSVAVFAVFVSVMTSLARLGVGNDGPGLTECLPEKKNDGGAVEEETGNSDTSGEQGPLTK